MNAFCFLILISICFIILYSFLILYFLNGWKKIREFHTPEQDAEIFVSIIVPFRNESDMIRKNFTALINQDYPASHLEIIYVDDHSDDDSPGQLRSIIDEYSHVRLIKPDNSIYGKKAAILAGVKDSKGELLLFTDADCFPVRRWASTMADFFMQHRPVMISGPVLMQEKKDFFSRFQSLEFLSLVGSGAGSFGTGNPVLCNGANIGFDRNIYLQYYRNIKPEIPSGDDIFMMLTLKPKYQTSMKFIKSMHAVVYTDPVKTLPGFLNQRIRWASKSRHYRDFDIIFTAFTVFCINLLILILAGISLDNWSTLIVLAAVFCFKLAVDYLLLHSVSLFFGRKKNFGLFLLSEVLYPVYSVFSAVAGILITPSWRNRNT